MAAEPSTTPAASRAGRMLQRFGVSLLAPSEELIDLHGVAGTAMDIAGEDWASSPVDPAAASELEACVSEVTPLAAEFTGLELTTPLPAPAVFNKSEWIVTTAANLKPLFEMVLKSFLGPTVLDEPQGRPPNRWVRAATTAEIGAILGYLSGRVLGQYDQPLTRGREAPAAFYFIYPNIREAEARLGLEPRRFRLWLALHEVTHALEFEVNPWLKEYLKDLIEEHIAYSQARLAKAASGALLARSMREILSPDENPVLAKAQSLMSILEGYCEYVMESAGEQMINGGRGIAELLDEARRTRSWGHKLIERFIGLQVKMEQYRAGYLFVKQAAGVGGMPLANLVWQGPSAMPTLTELRQPDLWISRMLKKA